MLETKWLHKQHIYCCKKNAERIIVGFPPTSPTTMFQKHESWKLRATKNPTETQHVTPFPLKGFKRWKPKDTWELQSSRSCWLVPRKYAPNLHGGYLPSHWKVRWGEKWATGRYQYFPSPWSDIWKGCLFLLPQLKTPKTSHEKKKPNRQVAAIGQVEKFLVSARCKRPATAASSALEWWKTSRWFLGRRRWWGLLFQHPFFLGWWSWQVGTFRKKESWYELPWN